MRKAADGSMSGLSTTDWQGPPSLKSLARRSDEHASLFIRPIRSFHLLDALFTSHPSTTSLSTLDLVHKLLKLVSISRPPVLTFVLSTQAGRPCVCFQLVRRVFLLEDFAGLRVEDADCGVDIDTVPYMWKHKVIEDDCLVARPTKPILCLELLGLQAYSQGRQHAFETGPVGC